MGFGNREVNTVRKEFLEGNIIPAENLEWTEMINSGKGVQLVEAWDDAPVFDVGQPADVKNEFGSASLRGQFETGTFNVAVGQSKSFASLPQAKAGKHVFLKRGQSTMQEGYTRITSLLKNQNSGNSAN
jgi:hypothetical protein